MSLVRAHLPWSRLFVGGLVACAVGCGGGGYTTSGYQVLEYFPLDAGTVWRFTSSQYTELYEVRSTGGAEWDGYDTQAFEWRFAPEEDLDSGVAPALFQTYYSTSDHTLRFHGWSSVGAGGESHLQGFPASAAYSDPPVDFARDGMITSETLDSESSGTAWTSSLVNEIDGYQTMGGGIFDGVLQLEFLDDPASCPVAGSWFLANGWGPVTLELALHPDDTWVLKSVETGEG